MDDIEKLSCKEELDISDVEHSASEDVKEREEKPKKNRKRRRREIDMIKLSDDDDTDDEGLAKKLLRRQSPGPNSPASHREPRTCVLKPTPLCDALEVHCEEVNSYLSFEVEAKYAIPSGSQPNEVVTGPSQDKNVVPTQSHEVPGQSREQRLQPRIRRQRTRARGTSFDDVARMFADIELRRLEAEGRRDERRHAREMDRLRAELLREANLHERELARAQASQKRRPLSRLLEQLLRNLEKRDPHQFFAWPVNDNFAPGYSNIIRRPMDFSTMKQKIDDNEYRSLNCFISDFKLMCNNAMKYNKAGTVYHKAARRLLHAGLKQLTPQKLRPLGDILTYMYEIPIRELGFDIGKMDVHKVLKRSSPIKSGSSECEAASDGQERQDSGDSVKIQMEAAREQHRRRLAKKAFPRMDADGKTTLCLVGSGAGGADGPADERPPTLGQYVGKLAQGTGALHTTREDRRNSAKCVKPLNYGPFSSYAPSYDGTFSTLTKDETHLIYHTLPSETGQGNEELLRFAPDSPWALLYDMEAMFPGKKQQPEPTAHRDDNDLSKVKIDIEELRSLSSELGLDTDFLSEVEEEVAAAQRDYGISAALRHTGDLLAKLEKEQTDRLSASPPWHLALCARPGGAERELARLAAGCLRAMLQRVPPRHVAPLPALRRALGVTLDHLDTPMAVDDFELELHELREASDPDSRSSHDK